MAKPSPLRIDLETITNDAVAIPQIIGDEVELAVGFFDLVDSTLLKVTEGHAVGTLAALQHNAICDHVAAKFNGTVVKHLGDGVIVTFASSHMAAVAAINVRAAMETYTDLRTKITLTVGAVQRVKAQGRDDIVGTVVDRCARLQNVAKSGEIVVDEAFALSVGSFLNDYDGLTLIASKRLHMLRGIGPVRTSRLHLEH